MFFSIIIPVYNVINYIDQCLESVITQEFDSFEVILVDDGSTDGSGGRCDAYAKKCPNVRVIHQENRGLSGARNTGLEKVSGEWILFVDSDDWIEKGTLSRLYERISEEAADLYSYNAYKTDNQGTVTDKLLFSVENKEVLFGGEKERFAYFKDQLMLYKTGWEVWGRVYRRSIIEENKIRFQHSSEVFAEDYLFTFQYLLFVKKAKQLCNIFYYYRQRDNSLMNSMDMRSVLGRLHRWAGYAVIAVKKNRLTYFKKNFKFLYFQLINYHMQTMLADISQDELKKELQMLNRSWLHRKWIKQLAKHKNELRKEMKVIKWL